MVQENFQKLGWEASTKSPDFLKPVCFDRRKPESESDNTILHSLIQQSLYTSHTNYHSDSEGRKTSQNLYLTENQTVTIRKRKTSLKVF